MTTVYDVAELESIDSFVYDVKILYQLHGDRFESFSDLCARTFDETSLTEYRRTVKALHAQFQSYLECKIPVQGYSAAELVPRHTLEDFNGAKSVLVERLFSRFHDESVMAFYETFFERVCALHRVAKNLGLKFNFVGTKTGRLAFRRGTFNPYQLAKNARHCIKARPGYHICQFDLKSSQPRMAIFSTQDNAFRERFRDVDDIYSVFPGDRERNKVGLLRWMFGAYQDDAVYSRVAEPIKKLREAICTDAYHDGVIYNRFHRPLRFTNEAPNVIFQNYVSSTEADALYELVQQVQTLLEGTQSRILFPFYDAIVCEIHDAEAHLDRDIQKLIENHFLDHVFFAKFPVEVKTGTDYAHMH